MAKGSTAEDRTRQAEIDAARAREIAEEGQGRRDRLGSGGLAALGVHRASGVTARIIREYVRTVMIEPVVKRMYDIGMGVETFDVPTEAGNIVSVPAPAIVQVQALRALVLVGVPTQLGLVDDDGQSLPGAIVLGELDMRAAQDHVHGARLSAAARVFSEAERSEAETVAEPAASLDTALTPAMSERVAAGEFEVVEVEEGVGHSKRVGVDAPPPPIDTSTMTPEQVILARRKAKRATNGR